MRGVNGMIWECSLLDPEEASIPQDCGLTVLILVLTECRTSSSRASDSVDSVFLNAKRSCLRPRTAQSLFRKDSSGS